MRTNIDIDDRLLAEAMRASGCKTKRATVEEGLRLLARKKAYGSILARAIHGKGSGCAARGKAQVAGRGRC
jgi:Arc/MetJ family transcription regulator